MKTKPTKRQLDGILLLNKPSGISSNQSLQRVKRFYRALKAGHTGTLDPLASGLLPICFGEATKFARYLLAEDKVYQVKAKLGVRTTTSDSEGEVVAEKEVPPYTLDQLDAVMAFFRGEIQQIPSMYSALKYQGQPLYKLARQGIEVERPSRTIQVHDLKLTRYANSMLEFVVHCSKGAYIRTLVDDFGQRLGCGAHVIALHRTRVGNFTSQAMHTFESLASVTDPDALLLPVREAVADLPKLTVTPTQQAALCQGKTVLVESAVIKAVALLTDSGELIGVGEINHGILRPRRLLRTA